MSTDSCEEARVVMREMIPPTAVWIATIPVDQKSIGLGVSRVTARDAKRLYYLTKPIRIRDTLDDDLRVVTHTSYVIVSAVTLSNIVIDGEVVSKGSPETYIFPSDAEVGVLSWSELSGSMKGTLDHTEALLRAGYDVSDRLDLLPTTTRRRTDQ